MAVPLPVEDPLALLVVALVLFPAFFVVYWVFAAFRDAGFTAFEATLLVLVAPVSHGLNLAVWERGNLVLAVNLAGFLVPVVVSTRIVLMERVPRARTALAVVLVAAFTYSTSAYVPGEGVRVLVLAPVALAAALAGVLSFRRWRRAPLLAYVAGALGVLVGADLLRLPGLLALEPEEPVALAIGGAGTRDAIFVAGLLAVALQLLLFAALGKGSRTG